MLNFVQPRVAAHYFWLVLLGTVGMLQVLAVWYRLRALRLVPRGWSRRAGLCAGLGVTLAAFAWFTVATPGVGRPGPAGFEIGLLFASAALVGLFFCRLVAWIIDCFN
jgi:hypothetical protein